MPRYDAKRIEARWQAYWDEHQTFKTPSHPVAGATGKMYVLDMFPYPSGQGLHVGHPEGYTATDIVCRFERMRGRHVLHPMGWDAFGLPAEEHAVKTGTHPRITTAQNIETFRRQLKMLGFSYDWSRELSTTDPDYYRWTQWIFLQLFDTWFDPACEWQGTDGKTRVGRGRPIAELPIPSDVRTAGNEAVRRYQDARRLAYQHEAPVNWCPALGTVLANEEVIDGKSERGSHPVVRLPLRQWMLRITSYAERLLSELDDVNWPESIKLLQRNWIGRSEGAEVDFCIAGQPAAVGTTTFGEQPAEGVVRVYTTRPDTLFGVTYMVLAPEHRLVDVVTTAEQRAAVDAYRTQAGLKSERDRANLSKEKTGVFTGGYALNPVNGDRVPIWIADYVLATYGSGAIMAVPAHDERDLEFAKTYGICVRPVVAPKPEATDEECVGFAGEGRAIHSGEYNGLPTAEFKRRITADLAARGIARKAINYRLRDWLFSRQRYWGEPFPLWHELDAQGEPTGLMRADTAADLPVLHPHMEDFRPTGTPEPMLAKAPDEWLYKTASDGVRLKRETNSMPQWAGSCWYYLRFCDNKNSERFIDPALEKYWLPVDLYIGGAEHAVLHLLYSRFWHKVLFDRGHVSHSEPFGRLVNQGMILGEAELTGYVRQNEGEASGDWVSSRDVAELEDEETVQKSTGAAVISRKLAAEQVVKKGDAFVLKDRPEIVVESRAYKMSKSRGNVINPDAIVTEYGADALRMYEMFMGPLEASKPWSMAGVEGVFRFLGRVWRLYIDDRVDDVVLNDTVQDTAPTEAQQRLLHRTIKQVTEDLERLSFNTAISRMMEFVNELTSHDVRPRAILEPFVLLLSPLAPHIAEELWSTLGQTTSLAYEPWPAWDPKYLEETEIELPVQVNGKLRTTIRVNKGADPATLEALAKAEPLVIAQLSGKTIVKAIVVPGRMINFVVK